MIGKVLLALAGVLAMGAVPAQARTAAPLLDCPLRDAPFSAQSPLIDVLLNRDARRLAETTMGQNLAKLPPIFVGTTPPTFAAILRVSDAATMAGKSAGDIAALDARLRALPVTDADRVARCARYDNTAPRLAPLTGKGPRLLIFEKINGFRDSPSVDAAHAALTQMAARKGWQVAITDKGGAFTPAILARFDAVIWNNISGDVLTLSQRKAFQDYLARGGGYVGLHGSAGDPAYFWDWYPDTLIGARFAGHPMSPQFQEARIVVDKAHPLAGALPAEWRMTDEWYSFRTNPRAIGAKVLLTLDESTYTRKGRFGEPLDMGDHPLAWTHCIGRGRVFYSAIGHLPQTYSQPQNVAMLERAIAWVATDRKACPAQGPR